MHNHPILFQGSPAIMLFIIPVVFLFCWLFNSYQLGKFKKSKQDTGRQKRNDRIALFIIGLFIIGAALAATAIESFFA